MPITEQQLIEARKRQQLVGYQRTNLNRIINPRETVKETVQKGQPLYRKLLDEQQHDGRKLSRQEREIVERGSNDARRREEKEARRKRYEEGRREAVRRKNEAEDKFWNSKQTPEEEAAEKANLEKVEAAKKANEEYWQKNKDKYSGIRWLYDAEQSWANVLDGLTQARIGAVDGRIDMANLDIISAQAHQDKLVLKEYEDFLQQLSNKQKNGIDITDDDRSKLQDYQQQVLELQDKWGADWDQLDKIYKAKRVALAGDSSIGREVWDNIKSISILGKDSQQRLQNDIYNQRLNDYAAAYDQNVQRYGVDAWVKNNQSNTLLQGLTGEDRRRQVDSYYSAPKNESPEYYDKLTTDRYIGEKQNEISSLNREKLNEQKFRNKALDFMNQSKAYKDLVQATQSSDFFSGDYWLYQVPNMFGSSNSSGAQAAANALQFAGMFAPVVGKVAAYAVSIPLSVSGATEENYGEVAQKRVDNLKKGIGINEDGTFKSEFAEKVMDDLKKQSAEYYAKQGFSKEEIAEHVSNNDEVLRDLANGIIKNNSSTVTNSLIWSTKGLQALYDADMMRTASEIFIQAGNTFLPVEKALGKAFQWGGKLGKKATGIFKTGDKVVQAETKAAAKAASKVADEVAESSSKYANGFRKPTTSDRFKRGFSRGEDIGESLGLGSAGSVITGTIGGTIDVSSKYVGQAAKAVGKKLGVSKPWADAMQEMHQLKYRFLEKLTPDKEWLKLALEYGFKSGKNIISSALSEGAEEGVQYLNSQKDFANTYGYGGMLLGDMVANDIAQGGRIAEAYLSLLGLAKSELWNDAEFVLNYKGGFALGGPNPGFTSIYNIYQDVNNISKEVDAREMIESSAILNREIDKTKRASNVEFAKASMSKKHDAVMSVLDRMESESSKQDDPILSQEDFDEKKKDAEGINRLVNDKDIRAKLEAKGFVYGTERYAHAIADIYDLQQQLVAAGNERGKVNKGLSERYSDKEFLDAVEKAVDAEMESQKTTNAKLQSNILKAQTEAVNREMSAAAQNGEDVNSNQFQEYLQSVRSKVEEDILKQAREKVKQTIMLSTRDANRAAALLKLRSQSNTAKDIFEFIERSTGLKTKRPDAVFIEEAVNKEIEELKKRIAKANPTMSANMSDAELLDFINSATDVVKTSKDSEIRDLEAAIAMIQADQNITRSYLNQFEFGLIKNQDGTYKYDSKEYKSNQKKQRELQTKMMQARMNKLRKEKTTDLSEEEIKSIEDEVNAKYSADKQREEKDTYSGRIDKIMKANDDNKKLDWIVNDIYSGDAVSTYSRQIADRREQIAKEEAEEEKKRSIPVIEQKEEKQTKSNNKKSKLQESKKRYQERKAKAKARRDKIRKRLRGGSAHGEIIPISAFAYIANDIAYLAQKGVFKFAQFVEYIKDVLGEDLNQESLDNAKEAYRKETTKLKLKQQVNPDNVSSLQEIEEYQLPTISPKKKYISPSTSTTTAAQYVQDTLLKESELVDDELSTYFDTIVDNNGVVRIYPNKSEIDLNRTHVSTQFSKDQFIDQLKNSNTEEDTFKQKLIELGIDERYSKYRNVDGIYDMLWRVYVYKPSTPNRSILIGKLMREYIAACFTENEDVLEQLQSQMDYYGDDAKTVKAQILEWAKKLKDAGITPMFVGPNIYGKDSEGNDVSSQVDLILVDKQGGIYVVDVYSSMYPFTDKLWNGTPGGSQQFTRKQRSEAMLHLIEHILTNKLKLNVKTLSVLPITAYGSSMKMYNRLFVDKSIKKDTNNPKTDLSQQKQKAEEMVRHINELVEEYNQLESSAKAYNVSFTNRQPITEKEYESVEEYDEYINTLSEMQSEIMSDISKVQNAIQQEMTISTEEWIYRQDPTIFEEEPFEVLDLLRQLESDCRALDVALSEVTTLAPITEQERSRQDELFQALVRAQYSLNDILQHPEASTVDVKNEQDLIATAMEHIANSNYGNKNILIKKWWLNSFAIGASDNFTENVDNLYDKVLAYYNTINTWADTFRIHLSDGLDDNPALLQWYSTILNNYFVHIVDNFQKVLDNESLDEIQKQLINNTITKGRNLIQFFNDEYGIQPDEMFNGPAATEEEAILRMPVKWKDLYSVSDKHSPALDVMSTNGHYYEMSNKPDFLQKANFTFQIDADDKLTVFITYGEYGQPGYKYCTFPFYTDLRSYKGTLTRQQIRHIKRANRYNKLFEQKIRAIIKYRKEHGLSDKNSVSAKDLNMEITLNKGSIRYTKDGSMHNVSDFLFKGNYNNIDLFTILLGNVDHIGIVAMREYRNKLQWAVFAGPRLTAQLNGFDSEYLKPTAKFPPGALMYDYSMADGQRIPVMISQTSFMPNEAQTLASLLKMYALGEQLVDGYGILDLLKMRLYMYDPERHLSSFNDKGNMIIVDNGSVQFGNEDPIDVVSQYGKLVQRLSTMYNMIDHYILNENMSSSQNQIFSKVKTTFQYNPSLQEITLPNGIMFTRDDFTHRNSNGTIGSTWLGYLLRNGILQTKAIGYTYKLVNFGNPTSLDGEQTVQEKLEEVKPKPETPSDLLSKLDLLNPLHMQIDKDEMVERNGQELSEFQKEVIDYFNKVLGGDFKPEDIFDYEPMPMGNDRVSVGICAASYIQLATCSPRSIMFHEAFHKILELTVDPSLRDKFYEMYRNKYGLELSERDVAEGLCDMFTEYMELKTKIKEAKGFGKLYAWFKKLAFNTCLSWKLGLKNAIRLYSFYHDINKGKYRNQPVTEEAKRRFKERFGIGLYYTVKNMDTGRTENFEHLANSSDVTEMVNALGFLASEALNMNKIGSNPDGIKITEDFPKFLLSDKSPVKDYLNGLIAINPAFAEVFEQATRQVKKKGKMKTEVYYPKFEALKDRLVMYLESLMSEYDGKFKDAPEDEDEDEKVQKANIDRYDRASYEFSKLDSTTARVKHFFATVPNMVFNIVEQDGKEVYKNSYDISKNAFQCPTYMPIEEVFNVIVNDCHEASSIQDLLNRLEKIQYKSPMHRYVYSKYATLVKDIYTYNNDGTVEIDYDKEALAIQILSCVRSQKIDFVIAKSNKQETGNDIKITSTSYERDVRSYPKQWSTYLTSGQVPIFSINRDADDNLVLRNGKETVFKDVANFLFDLQSAFKVGVFEVTIGGKSYNKLDTNSMRALKLDIIYNLNSIGIMFSEKAFDYMLQEIGGGKDADNIKSWITQGGVSSVDNFITTISDFVKDNGSINQPLAKKGYAELGFVKNLGNWMGKYQRVTVQQMTLGLNGKKLYSVSQNNSISHIVSQLNTLSEENNTVNTLSRFGYNLHEEGGFSIGSLILKAIRNKKSQHINLHTYIGFKTDNKGDSGSEYSKEAVVEDYVAKMTMLQNDYLIFPTLADKGTWVIMDGVEIPGMKFVETDERDASGNKTGNKTITVQGAPSVDYYDNKWLIRHNDAQLLQMIEYAKCERLAIQQCMEDLGYEGEIPGYTKLGRKPLSDGAKVINYHTRNKAGVEPNGTRFLSLTRLVIRKNGKFEYKNLNDPSKSSIECLKLANEYFFNKSLEEQMQIMSDTLNEQVEREVKKAEELGLIGRQEIKPYGSDEVFVQLSDKGLANLTNIHMNEQLISTLATAIMNQPGQKRWRESDAFAKKAYEKVCRSLAIAAILADVNVRSIISSQEIHRCFAGHPAFFKVNYDTDNNIIKDSTFDIQKRIGGMVSTGDDNVTDLPMMSSIYTCAEINDYEVGSTCSVANLLDQMFLDNCLREQYAVLTNDWEGAYMLSLSEIEELTEDKEKFEKHVDTLIKEHKIQGDMTQVEWDDFIDKLTHNNLKAAIEKAKSQASTFAKAYKSKINVADGASYITADMCEHMLRMRGAYNGKVKKAFDLLRNPSTNISWVRRKEAFDTIYDEVNLVATKYTAYGFRQHTLNGEPVSDLAVAYYNKFALFPIFPCLATGKMKDIYDKMLNEKVDMLFMNSAVKVGSQGSIGYGKENSIDNMLATPFNKYEQEFSYLRRQLNTDPEEGSTMAIGTQMVKIVMQNLRLLRDNYIHNSDGHSVTGQLLLDEIMDHILKISEIGVANIEEKFFTDGKVDPKKLSEYLKEQLTSRNANKGLIEAIQIDENGQLTCPLAATSDASWIESILISSINREVIDINTPGSSFVQRSVFAIEAEGDEGLIQGADMYNGQTLEMINEEGSMDAVISIDYFENILPKGLSFAEARQWLIDNGIIGKKAKANTIGYRIPTQAQSSIHALRFIDVLPATKSAIILPREFTKITGSDFDIDHLYLASYNYKVTNNRRRLTEDIYESDNIDAQDYRDQDFFTASHTDGLSDLQKEQNGLIDCMLTLLKDTGNSMNSLYKSIDNDTELLTSKADLIEELELVKHLSYNFGSLHELVSRKNDYITGKTGIGPYALNVTNQMLTYLYGVRFKETEFTKNTPIGHLHHLTDNNGDYIASWLSAYINAHVDIVKDPYISKLNVNQFTYNMCNLLVRSGVGEAGVWFLSTPIMKKIAEASNQADSEYTKGQGSKYKLKEEAILKVVESFGIDCSPSTIEKYTTSGKKPDIWARIDVVNKILNHPEALQELATNPNIKYVTYKDENGGGTITYADIFYAWKALEKYSLALSQLVLFTKIDTRKHGKSLVEINQYWDSYNKLFNPMFPEKSIWDMDSLLRLAKGSWIEYKTREAIRLPGEILATLTFNANRKFMTTVINFANDLCTNEDERLDKDTIQSISRGLLTAIKSKYMIQWAKQCLSKTDADIKAMFVGKLSMNKRLNMLKIAITTNDKYKRLAGNHLISQLITQDVEGVRALASGGTVERPSFITVTDNVDGSKLNENLLIDGWEDMLNDEDKFVRQFAEDLILYSFLTSGEYKGWNKLFKYVPPAWIRGEIGDTTVGIDGAECKSFSDYIEQVLSSNLSGLDLNQMCDDVISNNFTDYHLVKTMSMTDEDGKANFKASDSGSVLIGNMVANSQLDKVPMYIRVKKSGVEGYGQDVWVLYKKVDSMDSSTPKFSHPIYAAMPKAGYTDSHNNSVYEYGWKFNYGENVSVSPKDGDYYSAYERIRNWDGTGLSDWAAIHTSLRQTFDGKTVEKPVQRPQQKWISAKQKYTRLSVQNDPRTLYIFTDNTDRTSGGNKFGDGWYKEKYGEGGYGTSSNPTSAQIRGLQNAVPISTMRYFYKEHPGMSHPIYDPNSEARWHDKDFEEFKKVFDDEIQLIKDLWDTGMYDRIVSPMGYEGRSPFFGSKLTEITKQRTPKIYNYMLNEFVKLLEYIEGTNKQDIVDTQELLIDINTISDKTQSYGVVLPKSGDGSKYFWSEVNLWQQDNPDGIVAYRKYGDKDLTFSASAVREGWIGNPFSTKSKGKDTVQKFFEWIVTGNNFGESRANEEFRSAIIDKILSTEDSNVFYYTELNRPSHATVIAYLIQNKQLLLSVNLPSEEEIAADREFHNLNDTSLDSEVEINGGIKMYHKPFKTKSGKIVRWSVVNNFFNTVDKFFDEIDDLPYAGYFYTDKDGTPRPSSIPKSDKPLLYSIPYRSIKEAQTVEYTEFKDFINDINEYLRSSFGEQISADYTIDGVHTSDGKPFVNKTYSTKYHQLFVYNKNTRTMDTSSKAVYDAIMMLMNHPELGEFLSDTADSVGWDIVGMIESDLDNLTIDLKNTIENNLVPKNTIVINSAQQELFPDMSLLNFVDRDDRYEIFSEEEMQLGAIFKNNCNGK